MGDGSTIIAVPSRAIPLVAIAIALTCIFGSVGCCLFYGHDIGGIYWPYISDTAKSMPQAGFFAFGMSVVSVLILVTVFVHHGKVKLILYALSEGKGREGFPEAFRRASASRIAGCIAAPNLGLLASYDTTRSPGLHLVFVLLFFVPCLTYIVLTVSLYGMVAARLKAVRKQTKGGASKEGGVLAAVSCDSVATSLRWKRRIGILFFVFFALYLPVGMCLVTDWYDYRNDVAVHTFRAVCQHATVVCVILFFGTMTHDFGDLKFRVAQSS